MLASSRGPLCCRKRPREGHGPPLQTGENDAANRETTNFTTPQTSVGDDAWLASSRGHCGCTNTRGRDKSRPYERGARPVATRENANPAMLQTSVGADSISARFAPPQTLAGGLNPAPTNKFYTLDQKPQSPALRPEISPRFAATRASAPVYRSTTSRPCAVKCAGERKATRSWPVAAVRPW